MLCPCSPGIFVPIPVVPGGSQIPASLLVLPVDSWGPGVSSHGWDKCPSLSSDHFLLGRMGREYRTRTGCQERKPSGRGGTLGKWPHAGTEAAVAVRGASLSAWGRTRRLQGISWLVERSSDRRKTSLIFSVCPPWSQRLLSLGRGGLDLWGLVDSSSPVAKCFLPEQKAEPQWASQVLPGFKCALLWETLPWEQLNW